jgi:hypothetical protein
MLAFFVIIIGFLMCGTIWAVMTMPPDGPALQEYQYRWTPPRKAAPEGPARPAAAAPAAAQPAQTAELNELKARLGALEMTISLNAQHIETLRADVKYRDDIVKKAHAVIAKLKSDNAALAAENNLRNRGLTQNEYRNLQFCLHPDRVASLRDDELTARYTRAFRWLGTIDV